MTEAATIPRNGLRELGTDQPRTWRLTAENNQDDTGQTTDDKLQDDCQSRLCCFCMEPPLSVYKSSCPLIITGGSWPLGRRLPDSPLLTSKIKQTSLSTRLATLLAFEWWAARLGFTNSIKTCLKPNFESLYKLSLFHHCKSPKSKALFVETIKN